MKHLFEYEKFKDPQKVYKEENRKELDLDEVRRSKEFRKILDLGFKDETSDQQELNSTIKLIRTKHKQKEAGHGDVFYTIHPTGSVRRYNPEKSKDGDAQEGSGNDLRKFPRPFTKPKDYKKALDYLYNYLKRKQDRGDFR
jgi:hypothetical protein